MATFKEREVIHNYGGHSLKVVIADPLAQGWYDSDWKRLPEIDLLAKSRLKEGAKVFDLGAHQCVVAMMLAKEVGSTGKVIALEANLHNFETAQKNKTINGISSLEVLHLAIAEKKGVLHFNESLNGSVENGKKEWGQVEVNCVSIDDLVETYGPPDVMFLDIEGYECKVLATAQKAFAQPCDWFVEVHGKKAIEGFGGRVDSTLAPFLNGNYELFMASESNPTFEAFINEPRITDQRFFLIAIDKRQRLS